MSLKPIAPKNRRPARGGRPAPMPVVIVPKKQSGGSGWLVLLLLAALLGGGYFVYNHQQKNEAAIAARNARAEENRQKAEEERQRLEAEHESKRDAVQSSAEVTAMGTLSTPDSTSTVSSVSTTSDEDVAETEEEGEQSAMGSTSAPKGGSGSYAVEDTTPPPFDLKAEGKAAKQVSKKLTSAIDEAGSGDTFHDLQADLKRSFEVAYPDLFADENTIPPFPEKEQKTLRLAQGIYVCLNIAAELSARDEVSEKKHARFVNWLLSDKAKAARTFTYGLEHYGVNDMASAADLMAKLREAYLSDPSGAMKKIPSILKKGAKH